MEGRRKKKSETFITSQEQGVVGAVWLCKHPSEGATASQNGRGAAGRMRETSHTYILPLLSQHATTGTQTSTVTFPVPVDSCHVNVHKGCCHWIERGVLI